MSDPKRLLQGSLPAQARRALEAGKLLVPPPHAASGVLTALGPGLREGATLKATAGLKATSAIKSAAIGTAGALKIAGIVSVVGGVALATAVAGRAPRVDRARIVVPHVAGERAAARSPAISTRPESKASAIVVTPVPTVLEPQAAPSETVARAVPAAPRYAGSEPPSRASPPSSRAERAPAAAASSLSLEKDVASSAAADAAVAGSVSTLRAESAMVLRARTALRSGDALGALDVLRQVERQFPGGALYEEREALMVEALLATGQRAAAIRRGQAFLRNHAESPHASRIRPLVEGAAP